TSEILTLSLHDALPISSRTAAIRRRRLGMGCSSSADAISVSASPRRGTTAVSDERTSLQALFSLPETTALEPGLRARLVRHAGGDDGAIVPAEPLPVLADPLDALARLQADADMVAAAVLFAAGEWAAPLLPDLQEQHPLVHALVDGLQASGQVWALHAERGGGGNQEGLRRLLLAIVRDLRVV